MIRRLSGYFLVIASLSAVLRPAQAGPNCAELVEQNKAALTEIKKSIEAARVADKVPGITYSVYTKECLIDSDHFGAAGQEEVALDPSLSLFRLASNSKLFTAISVHQLVEQGVLSYDMSLMDLDRVAFVRHLKKYEAPERLAQWSKVKLRHLLSHQAGISKDVPGVLAFFNRESVRFNSYPSFFEFLNGLTSVEFIFPAGEIPTGIKYSNLGMNMLARVVESYNPEGVKFSTYVRRHILMPLHMRQTFYDIPAALENQLVGGFGAPQMDGNRLSVPKALKVGAYDGSIGVASTAQDLAKFGQELLNLMDGHSKLLKDAAIIREMFTVVSPAGAGNAWAKGPVWQTLPGETAKDPLWTGHTGTGTSERSAVLVSAEKNVGVSILFNVMDVNREKYVKMIVSALKLPYAEASEQALALAQQARQVISTTQIPQFPGSPASNTADLKKFTGVYLADIAGVQKITVSDDGHIVFYGQKLVAEDLNKGRFRFPPIYGAAGALFNSEPVVFAFDSEGKVTGMRMANVKKFDRVSDLP